MQKKFSFDSITNNKIIKGAFIALSGSAALGLLEYIGALKISNAILASFIVWFVPFAINAVREWMKGV